MKLNKLGRISKGAGYFGLQLKGSNGFTVTCIGKSATYTFNNVNEIEWIDSGKVVNMSSEHHFYQPPYDLSMWSEVKITYADKIERDLLKIDKN